MATHSGQLQLDRITAPNGTSYPLRQPVTVRVRCLRGQFVARIERIPPRKWVQGVGNSRETALADLGRSFDEAVSQNCRVPPHARTAANDRIATILDDLIDWQQYERENPLTQPFWGRIVAHLPDGGVRVRWLIGPEGCDDKTTVLSTDRTHPTLRRFKIGQWFHASVREFPDRVEWLEEPEEVSDPNDMEARRRAWEAIPVVLADQPDCWPLKNVHK